MSYLTKTRKNDDEMVPITSIRDIKNIYDKGIWRNMVDMLFPEEI